MKIGTRSILFGAHCWFIHPWFVAAAWSKLYGFPTDLRLWVAFFVHDLGYWGKPNIDGDEGESHPELGARIMGTLFDRDPFGGKPRDGFPFYVPVRGWYNLALYHSRYYAKRHGVEVSKLCAADKIAMTLEPRWLYLPRVILSGEFREFRERATSKYGVAPELVKKPKDWHRITVQYLRDWFDEYRGMK